MILIIIIIKSEKNYEQESNTISNAQTKTVEQKWTTNFRKQKRHTQPNNAEQTLTKEQRINQENLKRIMNGEQTPLQSLRNIEMRTVKPETEKMNKF